MQQYIIYIVWVHRECTTRFIITRGEKANLSSPPFSHQPRECREGEVMGTPSRTPLSYVMKMMFIFVCFMLCTLVLLFNNLVELQTITTETYEAKDSTHVLPLSFFIPTPRLVQTVSKASGEVTIQANYEG